MTTPEGSSPPPNSEGLNEDAQPTDPDSSSPQDEGVASPPGGAEPPRSGGMFRRNMLLLSVGAVVVAVIVVVVVLLATGVFGGGGQTADFQNVVLEDSSSVSAGPFHSQKNFPLPPGEG